jgi:hypothetical protein
VVKSAHTDSSPLSVFQQLVSERVLQENNLTTGRKIIEYAKIEVPQLMVRMVTAMRCGEI